MSEVFDAYYQWLGIPPKHQPPDHYRLLGLECFEDDPEVIRGAAERQIRHVRSFQLGPHSDVSQRLLNELATAKSHLLDPKAKAVYDAGLRAKATENQLALSVPAALSSLPGVPEHAEPPSLSFAPPLQANARWSLANPAVLIGICLVPVLLFASLAVIYLSKKSSAPAPVQEVAAVQPVLPVDQQNVIPPPPPPESLRAALLFFWSGEQAEVNLTIDGLVVPVPADAGMVHKIDPGAHTVRMARPGFDTVVHSIMLSPGQQHQIYPKWTRSDFAANRPAREFPGRPSGLGTNGPRPYRSGPPPEPLTGSGHFTGRPDRADNAIEMPSGVRFDLSLVQDDRSPLLAVVEDTKREAPGHVLIRNDRMFRSACLQLQQPGSPEPGRLITFHDRDLSAPAHMITYRNQMRDGVIRIWNPDGQTTYWCQYLSGRKNGFCCWYQGNALRLVGDWDGSQLKQAVLLSEGKPEKSFTTQQEAEQDPVAAELLVAVGKMDKEIDTVEKLARNRFQQMKEEFEDDARRKAVARTTAQTRQRMLNRVKQNADEFLKAQRAMERSLQSGKP